MDIDLTLRAIRNPARRRILHWLKCPDRYFPPPPDGYSKTTGVCAAQIQEKSDLSKSTVSQYLNLLEQAGLIVRERHGALVFVRRHEANIALFIRALAAGLGPEMPLRSNAPEEPGSSLEDGGKEGPP